MQRVDTRFEAARELVPEGPEPLHLPVPRHVMIRMIRQGRLELREIRLQALTVGGGPAQEGIDFGAVVPAPGEPESF